LEWVVVKQGSDEDLHVHKVIDSYIRKNYSFIVWARWQRGGFGLLVTDSLENKRANESTPYIIHAYHRLQRGTCQIYSQWSTKSPIRKKTNSAG
jgi:hypothetical protein